MAPGHIQGPLADMAFSSAVSTTALLGVILCMMFLFCQFHIFLHVCKADGLGSRNWATRQISRRPDKSCGDLTMRPFSRECCIAWPPYTELPE